MSMLIVNMTRMGISNITANMLLSDEQVAEVTDTCSIKPIDCTISLEEAKTVMGHIQEKTAWWGRDLLEHLAIRTTKTYCNRRQKTV